MSASKTEQLVRKCFQKVMYKSIFADYKKFAHAARHFVGLELRQKFQEKMRKWEKDHPSVYRKQNRNNK